MFGTMRIALNDNLLRRCPSGDQGRHGARDGHYVLNHVPKSILYLILVW